MTEPADTTDAALDGVSIWLVSDSVWAHDVASALRRLGAARVHVTSGARAVGDVARVGVGRGVDALARTAGIDAKRSGAPAEAVDVVVCDDPDVARAVRVGGFAIGRPRLIAVAGAGPAAPWDGVADAVVAADPARFAGLRVPVVTGGPVVDTSFRVAPPADELRDGRPVLLVVEPSDFGGGLGAVLASVGPEWALVAFSERGAAGVASAAAAARVTARVFSDPALLPSVAATADVAVVGRERDEIWGCLSAGCRVVRVDGGAPPGADGDADAAAVTAVAPRELRAWLSRAAGVAWNRELSHRASAACTSDGVAAAVASLWVNRYAAEPPAAPPAAPPRFETVGPGAALGDGAPMSRDEARAKLAELLLEERRLAAALKEQSTARERWLRRLALAEDAGNADLVALATGHVRAATDEIAAANARVTAVAAEKDEIRRRALSSGAAAPASAPAAATADAEARFRALERADDLARLRDRARDPEG
ncbi:MAG: hypothetical protein H6699_01230 [Myxococcales bacterium]|nr:hypothetical protein [Myxococcales bacterium]